MAKFEYRPSKTTRINLPAYRPGDIIETDDPERIAFYQGVDSLREIKPEPKRKSKAKDDDKAEPEE